MTPKTITRSWFLEPDTSNKLFEYERRRYYTLYVTICIIGTRTTVTTIPTWEGSKAWEEKCNENH